MEPPLTPPEPRLCCRCLWCDGELYAGNSAYAVDGGHVHRTCVLPLLEDRLGPDRIALLCGCRRTVL